MTPGDGSPFLQATTSSTKASRTLMRRYTKGEAMKTNGLLLPRLGKRVIVAVIAITAIFAFLQIRRSSFPTLSSSLKISEERTLEDYFPYIVWQRQNGIKDDKLPVDPINPPSDYRWHRWNSATVNTDKFIEILELIGTRKDFVSGMTQARHFVRDDIFKTMDMNADGFTLLTEHTNPMFVRNGNVYRPKDASHWQTVWAWLLDDAIQMARHLEPSNDRMKKLTNGDFPFLYDVYDYPFCGDDLVPIFRVNMIADDNECKFAWPFVSSMNYYGSRFPKTGVKTNPDQWDREFAKYDQTYPWESKIGKAVWRGSPTGLYSVVPNSPRFQMVSKANRGKYAHLMDVKFTPDKHGDNDDGHSNYKDIGGSFIEDGMPETDFMKSRAIIDIDGNAWSSRYGRLICFNSVVIKVESKYQAYFEKELHPWHHYIPVKADLSDLEENVEWAMSEEHEGEVRAMIERSREYCRNKFLHHSFVSDFMWTLLDYVELLENTPGFYEAWKENEVAYNLPVQQMTVENS